MSYETIRNKIDLYIKDYADLEKEKRLAAWKAGVSGFHRITEESAAHQIKDAIKENKWEMLTTQEATLEPQMAPPPAKIKTSSFWSSLFPKKDSFATKKSVGEKEANDEVKKQPPSSHSKR